jgi:hypothetical protein
LGEETGATHALLHAQAGMAVLFLVRIVSGRSLARWLPMSVVLIAALADEVLDQPAR